MFSFILFFSSLYYSFTFFYILFFPCFQCFLQMIVNADHFSTQTSLQNIKCASLSQMEAKLISSWRCWRQNNFLNKTIWKHLPMLLIILMEIAHQFHSIAIRLPLWTENYAKMWEISTTTAAAPNASQFFLQCFHIVSVRINCHLINTFSHFITFSRPPRVGLIEILMDSTHSLDSSWNDVYHRCYTYLTRQNDYFKHSVHFPSQLYIFIT